MIFKSRNGLRPRPGEPDNPGDIRRDGRLHIPPAGRVVITFRGQGIAGSIVGFEGRFFFDIAAAAAINVPKPAEIIAEIFGQVGAGGDIEWQPFS